MKKLIDRLRIFALGAKYKEEMDVVKIKEPEEYHVRLVDDQWLQSPPMVAPNRIVPPGLRPPAPPRPRPRPIRSCKGGATLSSPSNGSMIGQSATATGTSSRKGPRPR